jgi:hypothetical protein
MLYRFNVFFEAIMFYWGVKMYFYLMIPSNRPLDKDYVCCPGIFRFQKES